MTKVRFSSGIRTILTGPSPACVVVSTRLPSGSVTVTMGAPESPIRRTIFFSPVLTWKSIPPPTADRRAFPASRGKSTQYELGLQPSPGVPQKISGDPPHLYPAPGCTPHKSRHATMPLLVTHASAPAAGRPAISARTWPWMENSSASRSMSPSTAPVTLIHTRFICAPPPTITRPG